MPGKEGSLSPVLLYSQWSEHVFLFLYYIYSFGTLIPENLKLLYPYCPVQMFGVSNGVCPKRKWSQSKGRRPYKNDYWRWSVLHPPGCFSCRSVKLDSDWSHLRCLMQSWEWRWKDLDVLGVEPKPFSCFKNNSCGLIRILLALYCDKFLWVNLDNLQFYQSHSACEYSCLVFCL